MGVSKKSRNVSFSKTKAPAGCPLTQRGFSEHTSRKLIHFHSNLKKWHFPKKSGKLMEIYASNHFFTENLNGPYGPYEQLLWDISPNKWPKNGVFDENSFFWKVTMSKVSGDVVLSGENCGVPPQQNEGFKHNIPIHMARTVQKVTIIKFIWPEIARKPENKFYNRINLLICVRG